MEQETPKFKTAYQLMVELSKVCVFWSQEHNRRASNSEIRRWIEQGGIEFNTEKMQPNELIDFPLFSVVMFPNSEKRRITLHDVPGFNLNLRTMLEKKCEDAKKEIVQITETAKEQLFRKHFDGTWGGHYFKDEVRTKTVHPYNPMMYTEQYSMTCAYCGLVITHDAGTGYI